MYASAPWERSGGYDPPTGGLAPGGEGLPAKRGVRSISQTAAGSRTQAGATYATRRASGSLRRSNQDALPTPPSRHRREPNAGGDRGRPHARSQPHQGASVSPAWWLIDDDTERDLAPICSWDPPWITAEGQVFGHTSRRSHRSRRGRRLSRSGSPSSRLRRRVSSVCSRCSVPPSPTSPGSPACASRRTPSSPRACHRW